MAKDTSLTKPQLAAYWRSAAAAARNIGEPVDTYRKRVMSEECGVSSVKALNRTADFDKVMLRFANLFVAVVKETAAVGYIAVQDLTRASDYIRARTMEAFFPLVATAIIYFLICNALAWALKKVAVRHLSKDRSRIVKGVLR